jgi:hypothetical protein
MLHLDLGKGLKRRLEAQSRKSGIPVEHLARRWIEEGLKRDAG